MPKAYLIGGTPRCGKSSILQECLKRKPMYSVASDSIRFVLRGIVTADSHPALFVAEQEFTEGAILENCRSGNVGRITHFQNEESKALWPSLKRAIEGYISEGFDVVVEGVAILPELLQDLTCEYSAIFVGNTNVSHGQKILEAARGNEFDWMASHSDESILEFAKFTSHFSEMIKKQSVDYNVKYIEISDENYTYDVENAAKELLGEIK